MEAPNLNQDERTSLLPPTITANITIPLPNIQKNDNSITLPSVTEGDFKSPYDIKRSHFNNSTFASESNQKACLKNRLPDFNLGQKTLVSSRKFISPEKTRRGRTRRRVTYTCEDGRRRRRTTCESVEVNQSKTPNLPEVNSLTVFHPQRKAKSFAGFVADIETIKRKARNNEKMSKARKISYSQKLHELETNPKHCQEEDLNSQENTCKLGLDTSEVNDPDESANDQQVLKPRPIERFQKIVRLLCFLLKIKNSTDRKYKQQQHMVVFEQLEELSETVVCNDDGMVFDPKYFKAVKEVKLSQDAVHILSMVPGTRTEDQLQAALAGLKASVAAFGEYPLKMQKRLVTVGWYESFEAKRVIIRQGHRAENFYFILSGTALVTLLVHDSETGEQRSTTVAVLGKGSSFGELALLHHKTRSATVLCKSEVALLALGREDFRDIFMSYEDGKEPEHVHFLRTIPYMKDLPLEQCTTRPDVCIFHYFRRGVVIVKNSNTEWIYILKSGSCRVLTNLSKKKAGVPTTLARPSTSIMNLPSIPVNEFERRRLLYTASGERMHGRSASFPGYGRSKTEPITNKSALTLPVLLTQEDRFKKTVKKVNFALPWLEKLNKKDAQAQIETHRQRIETLHRRMTSSSLKSSNLSKQQNDENKSDTEKAEHICVQIELIKPKDQFGLASILYDNQAVKCHLVSNGAECILIKKSWFLQNASEAMLRELRAQIPPYPTQETLEQNLQDQANWDTFKSQTINDLLDTLRL